ncbi:hypothetical protein [Clostridium hydrogeniformans]|uniref:hypothetical protein n=1 Tax=Clostridium hydrogeniformans TaxID=349933 RepID=UPI0004837A68|nr:hypothetical protein [Clostridium hydrogeniformans]
MKRNKILIILITAALAMNTVGCASTSETGVIKNPQNTSAESSQTNVKTHGETNTQTLDYYEKNSFSKEEQEIVDRAKNSIPKLRELAEKEKAYYYNPLNTVILSKPNPNSKDKYKKDYYEVSIDMLPAYILVNKNNKDIVFRGINDGRNMSSKEIENIMLSRQEERLSLKQKSMNLRKGIKTEVKDKLQKKVREGENITDKDVLDFAREVLEPEFKYMRVDEKKRAEEEKVISRPNPKGETKLDREYYRVKCYFGTLFIKPTFEEKDIYQLLFEGKPGDIIFSFEYLITSTVQNDVSSKFSK